VGDATVRALVGRGHAARLLTRHAERDARAWPDGVEAHEGDVTRPDSLVGAADGCDAVLHAVGIVRESDGLTFDAVNVRGTRHVVDEAERAGVPHLVYVSSLGAERGTSDYHRSKRAGEDIVRTFRGRWVIVRPGNVYGPGDEVVSLILTMVRSLPVVPVIGDGDREFQPVWADDVGQALAAAVERADLAGRTLDVAGPERTCLNDLLDRFGRLTNRSPARVPVPGVVAGLGVKLADLLGVDVPLTEGQLTMLDEGNVIEPPNGNALDTVLGVRPTPLDEGLRRLLDAQPEQLPEEGVGPLHRKRFWADIRDATATAAELFARFCRDFHEISPDAMDLAAEPGAPTAVLERGQTVTMALPMRGNVQVRVAELGPTLLTLQTLQGHPLAGAVRFSLGPPPAAVDTGVLRFEVDLFERAANVVDRVAMATLGEGMQKSTWRELVERVVQASGGAADDGVQAHEETLDGAEAEAVEAWLRELALAAKQERNTA
jgi:NADH dehydrogenase